MPPKKEEIKHEKNTDNFSIRLSQSRCAGLSLKHWHRNVEICQVCTGEYLFVVGNKHFTAQAGDIVFVPAGVLHQMGSLDDASIRFCQFSEALLCNLVKDLCCIQTHITCREMQQLGITETVHGIMDELYDEYRYRAPEHSSLICAACIRLCSLLLRHCKTGHAGESGTMARLAVVQQMCEYIAQHYTDDISLPDLAEATNYSCSYISSLFTRVAGVSFKEYLETYRINKVIACINENGCSYSAAATRCGFNSIRTFNNAFRRVTGLPPSGYFSRNK